MDPQLSPKPPEHHRAKPRAPNGAPANGILSFTVRGQLFALPILDIQEVRTYEKPLPLPRLPPAYQGVLNFREAYVAVLDFGCLLGLAPLDPGPLSVIVIANCNGQDIGLAVDAVNDVRMYTQDDVKTVPLGNDGTTSCYVDGLLADGPAVIQLLRLSAVLLPGSPGRPQTRA